jgi:hypothetical protein
VNRSRRRLTVGADFDGVGDRDLMLLHVEALFTHDENGDLVAVNEPGGGVAPRFFIGVTREGTVRRFRYDMPGDLRRDVEAECDRLPPDRSARAAAAVQLRLEAVLARSGPVERSWAGPAYCFPEEISPPGAIRVTRRNADVLEPLLQAWLPDVAHSQPMLAVVVSGRAVAVCASVRRSASAHEAGVETASNHRRRGYAARAVSAWAAAVRDIGRVPLYSTSWQNEASIAVARKLRLLNFGNDLHIT